MKILKTALITLMLLSLTGWALADDSSDDDSTPPPAAKKHVHKKKSADQPAQQKPAQGAFDGQGYGTAGCGLGSILFSQQQKGPIQILASTTNSTFGTQTFGISSGTSNCTDSGTVTSENQVPVYIEANRQALEKDIARGGGESLIGLSHVLGCNDTQELAGSLKKHYRAIFPDQGVSDDVVTASLKKIVRQDAALSCSSVI